MRRLKQTNSEPTKSPRPPLKIETRAELRQMQRAMASVLFRPLTADWQMQRSVDGESMEDLAADFIKPNDRLTSFERLEIYNRQYWFRVLDCLWDDYPGLRAILGEQRFMQMATAYLSRHPSNSYTLRDLGDRLEQFLTDEPAWCTPREQMAREMVRFEWAQVVAFDGPSRPVITPEDLAGCAPDQLRLGLQPYLSLLELHYAVDDFLLSLKGRDLEVLRGEASNAVSAPGQGSKRKKKIGPPAKEQIYLAVHRFENQLFFKRLPPEAFAILQALGRGETVEAACEVVAASGKSEVDWAALVREWFDSWSALGWFCRPT